MDQKDVIVVKKGLAVYYTRECDLCKAELKVKSTLTEFSCPECQQINQVNKNVDSTKISVPNFRIPREQKCLKCCELLIQNETVYCSPCEDKQCDMCKEFATTTTTIPISYGTIIRNYLSTKKCGSCGYTTEHESWD